MLRVVSCGETSRTLKGSSNIMEIYGQSDIGLVRETNQDNFMYGRIGGDTVWAVVCDGMGGVSGGSVASEMACQSVSEAIRKTFENGAPQDVGDVLMSIIQDANESIFNKSLADEILCGMGTTVVIAIASGGSLHIAHVGDSRAYIISGKSSVKRLTTDHSIVQEMLDNGEITQQQAKSHPRKNIITRALGIGRLVECDYTHADLNPGDKILICTDGLTNYLDDEEFSQYFSQHKTDKVIDGLIDAAKKLGGADNITAVVISS